MEKRAERQSLGPTMREGDEKTKGGLGVAGVGGKDGRRRCLCASCGREGDQSHGPGEGMGISFFFWMFVFVDSAIYDRMDTEKINSQREHRTGFALSLSLLYHILHPPPPKSWPRYQRRSPP